VAAGGRGAIVAFDGSRFLQEAVPDGGHLTAVALDVAGSAWAAGASSFWFRRLGRPEPWSRAYHDTSLREPFVSITADVGLVHAVTVSGGVLCGRSPRRLA
jgi:hypothetical protein